MAVKLGTEEPRNDLTTRECAKLLNAFLGGLVSMAPVENVLDAVSWIHGHRVPIEQQLLSLKRLT